MSKENRPLGEVQEDTSPSFGLLNHLTKQTVSQYSANLDAQIAAAKALRLRYSEPTESNPTSTPDYTSYLLSANKK